MERKGIRTCIAALAALVAMAGTVLYGCGGNQPPPPAADTAAQSPAADQSAATEAGTGAQPLAPTDMTWTPEAMEELLAPVALYPDVVLGQVLVAATNPQEVLDAGNWLLQNQNLQGKGLDDAAKKVGFTAPMRGLLQSPETVDMMCSEMDWTTELGQAFVNDQAGVLDAVQRLRAQAKDVGNLQSSDQMKVETEVEQGKEVITVSPPSPQVVYVPQYDPVAVYAPPPPAAAPAPATTTTTTTEETGHSTEAMVATGLLSFGAGLLVANVFDDDDDDYGYYAPRYYGPPMPYYPPYPYRPRYGSGYYPSNGYNRPPNYQHGFNNNTVIVNKDNNYWNRRDNNASINDRDRRSPRSPITEAKPNRPELASLNSKAKDAPKRAAPATPDSWKGQSSYAGAKAKAGDARPGSSSRTGATCRRCRVPMPARSLAGTSQRPGLIGRPPGRPHKRRPGRPRTHSERAPRTVVMRSRRRRRRGSRRAALHPRPRVPRSAPGRARSPGPAAAAAQTGRQASAANRACRAVYLQKPRAPAKRPVDRTEEAIMTRIHFEPVVARACLGFVFVALLATACARKDDHLSFDSPKLRSLRSPTRSGKTTRPRCSTCSGLAAKTSCRQVMRCRTRATAPPSWPRSPGVTLLTPTAATP